MCMKRLIDVTVSLLALIVLSPLFLLIAFMVQVNLGSPVLFRQLRPGLNGNVFEILKFRTMKGGFDKDGLLLSDEVRLTLFGQKLRSSSLDELPGLLNVLKGDMSLVGPRPLLVEYLPLYNEIQAERHKVRPGITGWAQVNGRNSISWEDKFDLDVWYVNNQSFLLDIRILLLTIKKVFIKEGIAADGNVTIEKFTGSK